MCAGVSNELPKRSHQRDEHMARLDRALLAGIECLKKLSEPLRVTREL
jgi:hypothetical protein